MVSNRIIGESIIELTYGKLEDGRGRNYSRMSTRVAQILATAAQGYVVDLIPACEWLGLDFAHWTFHNRASTRNQ